MDAVSLVSSGLQRIDVRSWTRPFPGCLPAGRPGPRAGARMCQLRDLGTEMTCISPKAAACQACRGGIEIADVGRKTRRIRHPSVMWPRRGTRLFSAWAELREGRRVIVSHHPETLPELAAPGHRKCPGRLTLCLPAPCFLLHVPSVLSVTPGRPIMPRGSRGNTALQSVSPSAPSVPGPDVSRCLCCRCPAQGEGVTSVC